GAECPRHPSAPAATAPSTTAAAIAVARRTCLLFHAAPRRESRDRVSSLPGNSLPSPIVPRSLAPTPASRYARSRRMPRTRSIQPGARIVVATSLLLFTQLACSGGCRKGTPYVPWLQEDAAPPPVVKDGDVAVVDAHVDGG